MSTRGGARVVQVVGVVFCGLCAVFIAGSGSAICTQERLLAECHADRAVVLSASSRSAGSGGRHRGLIHWRSGVHYHVLELRRHGQAAEMVSADMLPGGPQCHSARVHRLAEELTPDRSIEVFTSNEEGARPFLLRERSPGPYVGLTFPMIHFTLGVVLIVAGRSMSPPRPRAPRPAGAGWFEARRVWGPKDASGVALVTAAGLLPLGFLPGLHYVLVAAPFDPGAAAMIMLALPAVVWVVVAALALRHGRRRRQASRVRFFVSKGLSRPGAPVHIRIEREGPHAPRSLAVDWSLEREDGTRASGRWLRWQPDGDAEGRQQLERAVELPAGSLVGAEARRTSDRWPLLIRVTVDRRGRPPHVISFVLPLDMRPP